MKIYISRAVFILSALVSILSLFLGNLLLSIILLCLSVIYLGLGWYLLNPVKSTRFDLCIFFFGYSFSTSLMAFLFMMRDYPMQDQVTWAAIILLIGSVLFLVISKPKTWKGFQELIINAIILLVLCIIRVFI